MAHTMGDLLEWSPEGKDFTFGAKTTPCLHPAAPHDATDLFELPGWMETRDNLGLASMDLFEDVLLPIKFEDDLAHLDGLGAAGDDILEVMNISDVLVRPDDALARSGGTDAPPEVYTAKSQVSNPSTKITINLKKIKIPAATPTVAQDNYTTYLPPSQELSKFGFDHENTKQTNDLLDELVKLVEVEQKTIPFSEVDSTMVEDNITDLLNHLEAPDIQIMSPSDVSSWGSEPASPDSICSTLQEDCLSSALPSPVPSNGSLSPFYSNGKTFDSDSSSLEFGQSDFSDNSGSWGAVIDASHVSNDSQSTDDVSLVPTMEDVSNDDNTDLHSYSRSTLKKKSRKTNARVSPYTETKKERKKEQNKQAALRYRQKKKQEEDDVMDKIKAEEERQKELQTKYKNLKVELSCMKKIMREVFIKKGIISADAFKK